MNENELDPEIQRLLAKAKEMRANNPKTGPLPPRENSKPIIAAPEDSGNQETFPDVTTNTDPLAWARKPDSGVVFNEDNQ